jgi:hypothetical protein
MRFSFFALSRLSLLVPIGLFELRRRAVSQTGMEPFGIVKGLDVIEKHALSMGSIPWNLIAKTFGFQCAQKLSIVALSRQFPLALMLAATWCLSNTRRKASEAYCIPRSE